MKHRAYHEIFEISGCCPEMLERLELDYVFPGSLMGIDEIYQDLVKRKVPLQKIRQEYLHLSVRSREYFLYRFAEMANASKLKGNVAEAGVYRGEFAKEINKAFPTKHLYLFDTFEGFSDNDTKQEKQESLVVANYLKDTSEKLVMDKMQHPENCSIHKGYFPETAQGIEDVFCFVNLDMDLYLPILNGLRFFYPKMSEQGIILIHDYFSDAYPNVKQAVADYEKETNITLHKMPIGDDISLAIIK